MQPQELVFAEIDLASNELTSTDIFSSSSLVCANPDVLRSARLSHNPSKARSLPDRLLAFTALTALDLSFTSLTGTVPDLLGVNLNSLSELNLAGNQLSGTLPPSLGSLSSLRMLNLSANPMEKLVVLPPAFCSLQTTGLLSSCGLPGGSEGVTWDCSGLCADCSIWLQETCGVVGCDGNRQCPGFVDTWYFIVVMVVAGVLVVATAVAVGSVVAKRAEQHKWRDASADLRLALLESVDASSLNEMETVDIVTEMQRQLHQSNNLGWARTSELIKLFCILRQRTSSSTSAPPVFWIR